MAFPRFQPLDSTGSWSAVFLLSGGALAYEVLLMRLFSQVHWHHLVGLIISLALLGYGASGSFLVLVRAWALDRYAGFFTANSLLFGIGGPLAYVLAATVPLNPLLVAWEPRQLLYFALVYLLLALPFFAVANAIGLTLWRYPSRVGITYGADLLGAGLGAGGVVGLLFLLSPADALRVVGLAGPLAALRVLRGAAPAGRAAGALLAGAATLGLLAVPGDWLETGARDYKPLSQALAATGARVVERRGNPLGTVTVVENRVVPVRYAPGLSLVSPAVPTEQRAVFLDGERAGVLIRGGATEYLDYLPSALAYHLLERPRVLVRGAQDTTPVYQGLVLGAKDVVVVEPNSIFRELLGRNLPPGARERVKVRPLAWRRFLLQPGGPYDLIQLAVGDALGEVAGLRAQQEDYRYTVEGLGAALGALAPRGLVSVTRGLQLPPRSGLKLVATAVEALERRGIDRPATHLALLRTWNSVTLLMGRDPLEPSQRSRIREFSRGRMFDIAYLPGMAAEEANRYNRLDRPRFYQGVLALLDAHRERVMAAYPFRIEPATDDRPYFHRYTRLAGLWSVLNRPAGGARAQVDWGYVILWIALLLALVSSGVFVLLPLFRSFPGGPGRGPGARVVVYFGALGLAFLFIEIAFIQRLQLLLGAPVYSVAVVLGGFLAFAGLGSQWSRRLARGDGSEGTLGLIALAIGVLSVAYLFLLPWLSRYPLDMTLPQRMALCLAIIAPLAVAMGMPFPLGLAALARRRAEAIPWAWGINGCASVVAALLAPLLAMDVGFSGLVLLALGLYLSAWMVVPRSAARDLAGPGG